MKLRNLRSIGSAMRQNSCLRAGATGATHGTGAKLARSRRAGRLRSGRTLVETLIAALLSLFVGSALLMLVQSTMTARTSVQDGNASMRDLRDCLDVLQNNLRNAQMLSGTGVFSTATSSSITCYTNMTGTTTTRYWLDTTTTPYTFKQTVGGVTTTLLSDVQSITFTYYVDTSTNYTSATAFTTTANPNAPSAAEMPNLAAVDITVSVTSGGVTRSLTTRVRLRNSPEKTHV